MTVVGEVMTSNPIVAQIPGSRNDVLRTMIRHNLTGLPVVRRSDGALIGMISRWDIFGKPDEDQLALIMNRNPEVIHPDDSIEKAAEIFVKRKFHHLPVVSEDNLVGILTPTDLFADVEKRSSGATVESLALSPCVPIFQEAPLAVALLTFKVSKVSALPVLDEAGRLVGILTDRDIFNRLYINGQVTMADVGIGEDEDEWTWEGLRNVMKMWFEVSKIEMPAVPVREIMVREPTTVFGKSAISDAARTMRRNDFGQLPVRDSRDNLIAMLYDLDVISVLARD